MALGEFENAIVRLGDRLTDDAVNIAAVNIAVDIEGTHALRDSFDRRFGRYFPGRMPSQTIHHQENATRIVGQHPVFIHLAPQP